MKSTMVELVKELEKVLEHEAKSPSAIIIARVIAEARAGEFHDFKNKKYSCGKVASNNMLTTLSTMPQFSEWARQRFAELAAEIRNGDYDEKADAEDLAMMRKTTPKELWGPLGLDRDE